MSKNKNKIIVARPKLDDHKKGNSMANFKPEEEPNGFPMRTMPKEQKDAEVIKRHKNVGALFIAALVLLMLSAGGILYAAEWVAQNVLIVQTQTVEIPQNLK